jgi:Domain of unknown function (DU1801)
MRVTDEWFLKQEEPARSCLQFLRVFILDFDKGITESWKYGMPFYSYKGKMICYVWVHKKFRQPYLGVVDGNKIQQPGLLQEKRARMKILLVDPATNMPVARLRAIMKAIIDLRK